MIAICFFSPHLLQAAFKMEKKKKGFPCLRFENFFTCSCWMCIKTCVCLLCESLAGSQQVLLDSSAPPKPDAGIVLEKFSNRLSGMHPALAGPLTRRLLAALDTSLLRRSGVRGAKGR